MPRSLNYTTDIIMVAVDIRSSHNVGSLFRTADGLGVKELILAGYTPYPKHSSDERLEYLAEKIDKQIAKTALGAEKSLKWRLSKDLESDLQALKAEGYSVYGLEQHESSHKITDVKSVKKIVIMLGNELDGLDQASLELCDELIEIPMLGKKESFNVVQAAAMAGFYFRFLN